MSIGSSLTIALRALSRNKLQTALTTIGMTIGVFVLVFLQPLFAAPDLDPQWLRSLHVLNALFIAGLLLMTAVCSIIAYELL